MDENISISVKDISKSYGKISAIKNATFQIKKGEIVGLLGPNGAGKSTTMRILGGLLSADMVLPPYANYLLLIIA